jgi:hypothetical protein
MITQEEYFAQGEWYFSESEEQQIPVDQLVPQHALNAWSKLAREYGDDFLGTRLSDALLVRVTPPVGQLRTTLRKYGSALVYVGPGGLLTNTARSRLIRAGARTTRREGDWLKGLVQFEEIKVNVRAR